jgi:hypothetical protein
MLYDRDFIEQAAIEAVSVEDYYELMDQLDSLPDAELIQIAGL